MFGAIIDWSLRHRGLVLVITLAVCVGGVFSFLHLPLDAFPDTTPVQVQINTVAAALGPEEMERQVTAGVEQAISGLKGLTEVRSLSKFGLSQVTAIFEDGTDIYFARQVINERLGAVELPIGINPPEMGPVATGLGEVYHYVLTSQTLSTRELRTIQDWIIKPQLRSVAGVAEVNSWGGLEKQYQVLVDPGRLLKHDLTLAQVFEALERSNLSVGGGVITLSGESLIVQGLALTSSVEDIAGIVITAVDGVPIRIADVGEVAEGHDIRRGAVTYGGRSECVLGLGFMLMGENSREATERLARRMEQLKPTLPPGAEVTEVYKRTTIVDHVLRTVRTNLIEGAILVVVVLLLFLGNLRAGLVVASAIPLSMLCAGNAMLQLGIAGTLMSLGAIDFGLLVDSAVIMVENSVRRVSESSAESDRMAVIRDAILEVRRPTMFGELIIMIVYLPILTLQDIEGKLFGPMALTVVIALFCSLLLSLTALPALTSLVIRRGGHDREPLLVRFLGRLYEPVLDFVLSRRAWVMVGAGGLLSAGTILAPRLGAVFIPRLSEEAIVINTVRLAGVSVEESVRYGLLIEQLLLEKFPDEIEHVWSRTGTAEVATDPMGLEVTDVFLTLRPREQWRKAHTQEELVELLDLELAPLPGMRRIFAQPIELRVNEMIAGIRSDVGVKIFGDDFAELQSIAGRVNSVLRSIPGSADVNTEQLTGQPVLQITPRPDQLGRMGVSAGDVLDFVRAIGGVRVADVRQGQIRFPLVVRLPDEYRSDPQRVADLLIPTASGQQLPLSRLADIMVVSGPSTIQREWGKRRIVVQSNVRGRDVASFVGEARDRIAAEVRMPPGYYVRFGGQFEHLERGSARLMLVVPAALALIFALLYITYGRWLDCVRIFLTLPLSAVGGVIALALRDMPFSISAGVGFVAMSGVSVLGDMVFVSHLRSLLEQGQPIRAAVRSAALTRMRPVLMTGLVASLGFLPMAVSTGVGAEVQRPLATVVIGCVLTSVALTLLVLPVMCTMFQPRGRDKREGGAALPSAG